MLKLNQKENFTGTTTKCKYVNIPYIYIFFFMHIFIVYMYIYINIYKNIYILFIFVHIGVIQHILLHFQR